MVDLLKWISRTSAIVTALNTLVERQISYDSNQFGDSFSHNESENEDLVQNEEDENGNTANDFKNTISKRTYCVRNRSRESSSSCTRDDDIVCHRSSS